MGRNLHHASLTALGEHFMKELIVRNDVGCRQSTGKIMISDDPFDRSDKPARKMHLIEQMFDEIGCRRFAIGPRHTDKAEAAARMAIVFLCDESFCGENVLR